MGIWFQGVCLAVVASCKRAGGLGLNSYPERVVKHCPVSFWVAAKPKVPLSWDALHPAHVCKLKCMALFCPEKHLGKCCL